MTLGAALSFGVQPLVARALLPAYGGAAGVWLLCLLFFQGALLLAHAGALLLAWRTRARTQRWALALLALLALAVTLRAPTALVRPPAPRSTEAAAGLEVVTLVQDLALRVGLPFVLLVGASPLVLHALARRGLRAPEGLYADANGGALLGLAAYPVLVEPLWSLETQARAWTAGLALYALALVAALRPVKTPRVIDNTNILEDLSGASRARPWGWWVALAACSSALLAALTAHVTTDVAPGPLWWTLPLGLYLGSWLWAFAGRKGGGGNGPSPRALERASLAWLLATVALGVLLAPGFGAPLWLATAVPLVALATGALRCHALLAQRYAPAQPRALVLFSCCVALGGVLGTALVAVVAPRLFVDRYELPLVLLAAHGLFALDALRHRAARAAATNTQRLAWLGLGLAVPVLAGALYVDAAGLGRGGVVRARARSFYGPVYVLDGPAGRLLRHGRTTHGLERRDASGARRAGAYYGPETPFARALAGHGLAAGGGAAGGGAVASAAPRRLGVVGLGVGSAALYPRRGDTLRFFELDGAVAALAQAHFGFLAASPARVELVVGDGRAALQREASAGAAPYDVLVLDAFQSDAVPTHLLTREAFVAYLARLAPQGVLVVHVSNRHLALERVVVGAARALGLAVSVVETPAVRAEGQTRARWAVLARPGVALDALLGAPAQERSVARPVLWTDAHASVLALLLRASP